MKRHYRWIIIAIAILGGIGAMGTAAWSQGDVTAGSEKDQGGEDAVKTREEVEKEIREMTSQERLDRSEKRVGEISRAQSQVKGLAQQGGEQPACG